MEILSSGTAPCNREAQIRHSCKSGAGARQGATTSQAVAWLLLCLPLALQHQVPASAPHRARLLICCQTTPSHLLSGAEGRGMLSASTPHCATPHCAAPQLCWNKVPGHCMEHFGREAAGSKQLKPSGRTDPVPQLPPLETSPWFAADGPRTYAHLMDHLRAREMGESLPFSASACSQPRQCHGVCTALVLAAELRCSCSICGRRSGSCSHGAWRAGQELHLHR